MAPFRFGLWLVICGTLILAIAILLLSKWLAPKWRHFIIGGRLNRSPVLNMWTLILGNPHIISGRHIGTFSRTLILLWIFLWFVIRNSYQGALYNNMQSRRFTSAFDSIEKIQQSDCKILTTLGGYYVLKDLFGADR